MVATQFEKSHIQVVAGHCLHKTTFYDGSLAKLQNEKDEDWEKRTYDIRKQLSHDITTYHIITAKANNEKWGTTLIDTISDKF